MSYKLSERILSPRRRHSCTRWERMGILPEAWWMECPHCSDPQRLHRLILADIGPPDTARVTADARSDSFYLQDVAATQSLERDSWLQIVASVFTSQRRSPPRGISALRRGHTEGAALLLSPSWPLWEQEGALTRQTPSWPTPGSWAPGSRTVRNKCPQLTSHHSVLFSYNSPSKHTLKDAVLGGSQEAAQ